MPRLTQVGRIGRVAALRNMAVDLVAPGRKLLPAKKLDRTIEVIAYEGERIAILYNTPRVDLRFAGFPDHVAPKSFTVEVLTCKTLR